MNRVKLPQKRERQICTTKNSKYNQIQQGPLNSTQKLEGQKFLDDNFIVFKFVFKFSEFFGKLKKKIKNIYI